MKLSTAKWTNVQNRLPETPEGRRLNTHIEHRTWGKRWSQDVAIALRKSEQEMVNAAVKQLEDEEASHA